MSEFKGTPGPWEVRVEPLDQTVALDVIGCGVMVSSATPWSSDTECDIGRAFSNANLIAAAPELLEALQWMKMALNSGTAMDIAIGQEKADAAITKALGQ